MAGHVRLPAKEMGPAKKHELRRASPDIAQNLYDCSPTLRWPSVAEPSAIELKLSYLLGLLTRPHQEARRRETRLEE